MAGERRPGDTLRVGRPQAEPLRGRRSLVLVAVLSPRRRREALRGLLAAPEDGSRRGRRPFGAVAPARRGAFELAVRRLPMRRQRGGGRGSAPKAAPFGCRRHLGEKRALGSSVVVSGGPAESGVGEAGRLQRLLYPRPGLRSGKARGGLWKGSPAAAGGGSGTRARAASCFWRASKRPGRREAPSARACCDAARLWPPGREASSGGRGAAGGWPASPPPRPSGAPLPHLPRTPTKTRRRRTMRTSGCLWRREEREAEGASEEQLPETCVVVLLASFLSSGTKGLALVP